MNKKSLTRLLVLLIVLSAVAAAIDQGESERKWLSMSGTVIKTLEALAAHNATLPPRRPRPATPGSGFGC